MDRRKKDRREEKRNFIGIKPTSTSLTLQDSGLDSEKEVDGGLVDASVQQALEALNSHVKKKSNLGEEGYDIARDRGMVKPAKDKKDGTSYPPSEEMKKTQKVNTGPSAAEIVKKKYGKAVMNMDKK